MIGVKLYLNIQNPSFYYNLEHYIDEKDVDRMKLIVWILLLATSLLNIGINVSKKYIMIDFGEITLQNVFKISTWFKLLTNPFAIIILGVAFGIWGLSMWAFSIEEANKVVLTMSGLSVPVLLLNIYLNFIVLNETLTRTQLTGLGISIIGMVGVFIGLWLMVGGIK